VNDELRQAFGTYLTVRANSLRAELEATGELLSVLGKPFTVELSYNLKNVKTERTEGRNGYYQKAAEQDSGDYRKFIVDLKAHDGKLTRDGLFCWLFDDRYLGSGRTESVFCHIL